MKNKTATTLATLVVGTLVLTGCSGGDSKVSGLRDDVKVKPAIAEQSHREKKTKTECTRRVKGVCKSSRTVPDGTKKVIDRHAKAAVYCVELDDVNGKPTDDDQWYEVTITTYHTWADKNEGTAVTDMKYTVTGCTQ